MAKHFPFSILAIYCAFVSFHCWAITDVLEVQTLQDLYQSLNSPQQLQYWKAESGDPCEESWKGIECSGSSLITLDLHGLDLTGTIRIQFSTLKRLKYLDLSSNNIEGSISYIMPPNVTHLILADNRFTGTIPYAIGDMKHLRHLNLSHNLLFGRLADVFNGLENLKEMDLSYNYFIGSLPTSFRSLTNLTGLFLQNNQFTGSVIFLANLSLTDLNMEDNSFGGLIPGSFKNVINLRIAGNNFVTEPNYGPWKYPTDTMPREKYISVTNAITVESYPSQSTIHIKRKQSFKIVMMIGAIILAAALEISRNSAHRLWRTERDKSSVNPDSPVNSDESVSSDESMKSLSPNAKIDTSPGREVPTGPVIYSTLDLLKATKDFSNENFISTGPLCSGYIGELKDGTAVAIKRMEKPSYINGDEECFDVIEKIFNLKHPNIIKLLGYIVYKDQYHLVYECTRNLSLNEALHTDAHEPLSYRACLQIALGVAHALDYLHSSSVPPTSHSNLKTTNILLDEELQPLVCGCDLAIMSKIAKPGSAKADVCAFGELLFELLTRKKRYDSARPEDDDVFLEMVDPDIVGPIPSGWLSRTANIVSLCIQPAQERRPTMSEIANALEKMLLQFSFAELADATDNFSSEYLVEDSEWWKVYDGSFADGEVYAVKQLANELLMRDDDQIVQEVSRLKHWSHPNLVSIIGFCIDDEKRYIITDLTPPRSLASLIYDSPRQPLDWSARISIALQVAYALNHLHEYATFAKDLSADTVFVGDGLRAQISDVWIPRVFYMPDSSSSLSPGDSYREIADPYATIEGYQAPDFIYPSGANDVYSFGVLLLVLISGKRASQCDAFDADQFEERLIYQARPYIKKGGQLRHLVDSALVVDTSTLEKAIYLVKECCRRKAESRPGISDVIRALYGLDQKTTD